ncbi:cadherin-AgCad1-like isoform X2 [Panulirus ornatus]|uniref:cadherin-AgCad1-like isoform X2 n=1 Tax=Panulirus ornatus TaxID=150431 RepID=UPI003A851BE2
MMARGWVMLTVLVVMMVVVEGEAPESCPWLTIRNKTCLQKTECEDTGTRFYIFEDCEAGSELFIINDSKTPGDACKYLTVEEKTVRLLKDLDAETVYEPPPSCVNFVTPGPKATIITILDVNEYNPTPEGHGQVVEFSEMENKGPRLIGNLTYSDQDRFETASLDFTPLSGDGSEEFKMEKELIGEEMVFLLSTKKSLDFESRMYYKLAYDIISTDDRGNIKKTEQSILVSVEDDGDNEPYWISYYPSFSLEECYQDMYMFTVEARDRDIMINNAIQYSITSGNDDGYFKIDEIAGNVTTNKTIDREHLAEDGIRDFSLGITATEYNENGSLIIPESNATQVTEIFIVDKNNKKPVFTSEVFCTEMRELTGRNFPLDLNIYVYDMDEGNKGTFTLTSSMPDDLKVIPHVGMHNQSVTLEAQWNDGNTSFDYECQNATLNITIFATEIANASHAGSTSILISLIDVNDHKPEFLLSEYNRSLSEITDSNTSVLNVTATDGDISPDFGSESIRYFLKSCTQLEINNMTGEVLLISTLDYEMNPSFSCVVEARDENGTASGNSVSGMIFITVDDAVDEPPEFIDLSPMNVTENSGPGTYVGTVVVEDADSNASISFDIDWDNSVPFKNGIPVKVDALDTWFQLDNVDSSYPKHIRKIQVGAAKPDYELADKVDLEIIVVDRATQLKSNSTTGTVKITILDENDTPPEFEGNYDSITVKENVESGITIYQLKATDPDLNDIIKFSIDNDTLVKLSEPKVDDSIFTVDLQVQEGADIDRERMDSIVINVTIEDEMNHTDSLQITISVTDINDNSPIMDPEKCNRTVEVAENSGDGKHVAYIEANDKDEEDVHREVSYSLLNEHLEGEKNRRLPFKVNITTGEVVVFLDNGKREVNREQDDIWELIFKAYDHCDDGDIQDCKILESEECYITINVTDENDEAPQEFEWIPNDDPLIVNEFMKKDEEAKAPSSEIYKITAHDGDLANTNNTRLTFKVLAVRLVGTEENKGLFEAVNKNESWSGDSPVLYYSTLRATKDLSGERGLYDIDIMALDHGNPQKHGNYTIRINVEDANDHEPQFRFNGCPYTDLPTVEMEENFYEAGDEVRCTDNGQPFEIYVDDVDSGVNSEVNVTIDYEKSSSNVDGEGQMRAFVIKQKSDRYALYVTEKIDKEKGGMYNLSLYAVDFGNPPKNSSSVVQVIVSNDFEFPPYFCLVGLCDETLYMVENEPDVSASFKEATDMDNVGVDPEDIINYNKVYYHIAGGDTNDFKLDDDNTKRIIHLRNKPDGLDREKKSEYLIAINVFNGNDDSGLIDIDEMPVRNNTLYVTILVQDKNDNPPAFPRNVTFASFTTSDMKGKTLLVIEAKDPDLNESLSYWLENDFQWFDTIIKPENPFRIESGNNNSANLLLNFIPTGEYGYCTFTINVHDAVDNNHTTQAKVYEISMDFQLYVYFRNDYQIVQQKEKQVSNTFTMVYGYPCIIDTIAQSQNDLGENIDGETTVVMHFINDRENAPVSVDDILEATTSDQVISELLKRLNDIGLNLKSVGPLSTGNDINYSAQQILVLEVLLGVVSLVLGSLVFMLLTAYCIRTKSLQRRVHVLSTNTFGSQSSDLNRLGMDMMKFPGSNKFTSEGANPMYNMSEADLRNEESSRSTDGLPKKRSERFEDLNKVDLFA